MTTRHEVLVAVTVDARRVQLARDRDEPVDDALAALVLEELRLVTVRLEDAGLRVDVPLSPGEVREVLRTRLDPSVQARFAALQRAGFRDSLSEHNSGPLAVGLDLQRVQIDGVMASGLLDRGMAPPGAAPRLDGTAAAARGWHPDDRGDVRADPAVALATPDRPRRHPTRLGRGTASQARVPHRRTAPPRPGRGARTRTRDRRRATRSSNTRAS